jgi:hypothetical protein
MMANGLYGTAGGGMAQGGFGCGQTVNGPVFPGGYSPGGFPGSGYPGAMYAPGGAYMPGMTNYGIPGAGINPLALQGQYMNQMADQQRSIYAAEMMAQQGMTAANQSFGIANSMLASGYQYGGGYGGFGGGYSGYGLGQSSYGLNSYLGGTFGRSPCGSSGSPFGGSSFSVCGSIPLGGSYVPTYSNGGYGATGYGTGFSGSLTGSGTFLR